MKSYNQKIRLYGQFGSKVSTFNYQVKNIPDDSDLYFLELFPTPKRSFVKSSNPVTRSDSVKRSLDRIFDICILNDFNYFVTYTFDDKIVSGFDYVEALRTIRRWFSNQVQNKKIDRYIIVPELHHTEYELNGQKLRRIHFHGLVYFSDISVLVDSDHHDKKGRTVYNVSSWRNGFTTAVMLDSNSLGVAIYITKYITKEIVDYIVNERITKRFYYAGGDLVLDVPTYWNNVDYDSASGIECDISFRGDDSPYKVKYDFLTDSEGQNYAYFEDITDSDIEF